MIGQKLQALLDKKDAQNTKPEESTALQKFKKLGLYVITGGKRPKYQHMPESTFKN